MERERNFLPSLGPIALRSKWLFRIFMEAIARLWESERGASSSACMWRRTKILLHSGRVRHESGEGGAVAQYKYPFGEESKQIEREKRFQ